MERKIHVRRRGKEYWVHGVGTNETSVYYVAPVVREGYEEFQIRRDWWIHDDRTPMETEGCGYHLTEGDALRRLEHMLCPPRFSQGDAVRWKGAEGWRRGTFDHMPTLRTAYVDENNGATVEVYIGDLEHDDTPVAAQIAAEETADERGVRSDLASLLLFGASSAGIGLAIGAVLTWIM